MLMNLLELSWILKRYTQGRLKYKTVDMHVLIHDGDNKIVTEFPVTDLSTVVTTERNRLFTLKELIDKDSYNGFRTNLSTIIQNDIHEEAKRIRFERVNLPRNSTELDTLLFDDEEFYLCLEQPVMEKEKADSFNSYIDKRSEEAESLVEKHRKAMEEEYARKASIAESISEKLKIKTQPQDPGADL